MGLKGSKTEQNLKDAFAGESQANRRYLYFANKADVEGQNDVAALFRSTAEGETGHAHGHLEFLELMYRVVPAPIPGDEPPSNQRHVDDTNDGHRRSHGGEVKHPVRLPQGVLAEGRDHDIRRRSDQGHHAS